MCSLGKQVIRNMLHQLRKTGQSHGFVDVFGQGVQVTRMGDVGVAHECSSVNVTLRNFEYCSEEVPVTTSDGRDVFMDSQTRVLEPHGNIVPCTDVFDRKFDLDGVWYCQYPPRTKECDEPELLNVPISNGYASIDLSGIDGGALSPEQIEEHKQYLVISFNVKKYMHSY